MTAGREKYTAPSITLTAFNCPHCHVFTTHTWYSSHAEPIGRNKTPTLITPQEHADQNFDLIEGAEDRARLQNYFKKLSLRRPFLWSKQKHIDFQFDNVSISLCYDCLEPAIWVADRIMWPAYNEAPAPRLVLTYRMTCGPTLKRPAQSSALRRGGRLHCCDL
jgi:hypothetical protein